MISVSQATRPFSGSPERTASSTESEIWSAILSGWPSVTDSEVKRNDRSATAVRLPDGDEPLEREDATVDRAVISIVPRAVDRLLLFRRDFVDLLFENFLPSCTSFGTSA